MIVARLIVACMLIATAQAVGSRTALAAHTQPAAEPKADAPSLRGARMLLFTKTAGFRHGSIKAGSAYFKELAKERRFEIVQTEDSAEFNAEKLAGFDAVIFLNTTGDVLNDEQQSAFEHYIRNGGGYLGIHAASDTEFEWEFYGELVGAYFSGHPRVQKATVRVDDHKHPSTRHLPTTWPRTDEWYNFRKPPENVHVLLSLDTSSYEGSTMGDDHPIAWCRQMDKGRSLYTGGGHTNESFVEPAFQKHLIGSLLWVTARDHAPSDAQPVPSDPS